MPNNWKTYKLSDALEIKYGKDHKKVQDGNIPIYGTGGIMRYGNQALYDKETILIPRKGSLNNIYYLNEPFWSVDTIFWSKINEDVAFPKYLFYNLKVLDFASMDVGSAIPSLTTELLKKIEIELPSLQEQKSIAQILSTIDDKIENNLAINKTLEEMAMALYKHWFVDFGPFQNGEFIESELVSIPKGWKIGYLKDILKFKKNNIKPSETTKILPYVPIDCIKSKQFLLDDFKSGEEAKSSLVKFEKGDFIFGAMRVYFHKVCIAPFEGTSRSTAFVFNTHTEYQYSYGLCLLNDENTISFAASNSQGSTIPYAKWDKVLSDMKIIIPTDTTLNDFNEIINVHLKKIIELFHENQTLTQLRDTLLPKLISGEVRLKEFRE